MEHSHIVLWMLAIGLCTTWLFVFFFELFSSRVNGGLFYHLKRVYRFYRQHTKNQHRFNKSNVLLAFFLLFCGVNFSMLSSNMGTK